MIMSYSWRSTTLSAPEPMPGIHRNGIRERFDKTVLNEFYEIAFRKKLYRSLGELQQDLDVWMEKYNTERTHERKMCCGRTPFATMLAGKEIWNEKVTALN
jgi:hypothetical protein